MITLTLCLIFFVSLSIVMLYDFFKKRRNSESFVETFKNNEGITHLKLNNNNKEYYFLIDTGANSSFITPEILKELKGRKTNKKTSNVTTANGGIKAKCATVPFCFNKECFEFEFWVVDIKNSLDNISIDGNPIIGVLGTDFLAHFGFVLDFDEFRIYKS